MAECKMPHLGLATTRELLDELRARFEIHAAGGLDYRTVDGEEIANKRPTTRLTACDLKHKLKGA